MKSWHIVKLGKIIISSNVVLSILILPQNITFVHMYPYLYLTLFTYIDHEPRAKYMVIGTIMRH